MIHSFKNMYSSKDHYTFNARPYSWNIYNSSYQINEIDNLSLQEFVYPFLINKLPQEIVDIIFKFFVSKTIFTVKQLSEDNTISNYSFLNICPEQINIKVKRFPTPNPNNWYVYDTYYIIPFDSHEKEIYDCLRTIKFNISQKLYQIGNLLFEVPNHSYYILEKLYQFVKDKFYFAEYKIVNFTDFCDRVEKKYLFKESDGYVWTETRINIPLPKNPTITYYKDKTTHLLQKKQNNDVKRQVHMRNNKYKNNKKILLQTKHQKPYR